LLKFIQGMRSYRTSVESQKYYNERKAGFPVLKEGEDVVSVIGGAQFKAGQGGRQVAQSIELLAPNKRFIPIENPETDTDKQNPNLLEKMIRDKIAEISPDFAAGETIDTAINAFRQVANAINPFGYSTAAAQAIANTRLAEEQGKKGSVVSYSLGGADNIQYAQTASYLGMQPSALAMAYPFLNFTQNTPKGFNAALLSGDPLGFAKLLGLGVNTDQFHSIQSDTPFGLSNHHQKHLFKEQPFLDLFYGTINADQPNMTPSQQSKVVHAGDKLYEVLGSALQLKSLKETGDFDKTLPYHRFLQGYSSGDPNVNVEGFIAKFFEGLRLTSSFNTKELQPISQALKSLMEPLIPFIAEKFKQGGANLPENPQDFAGYQKYQQEAKSINRALLEFKSGKLADIPSWYAGNLEPNKVKSRTEKIRTETIPWFTSEESTFGETYTKKIVEAYRTIADVADEFIKTGGRLSQKTKDSIKTFEVDEFSGELTNFLSTHLDTSTLPKEEEIRQLQVTVPEIFLKKQSAILAYNKILDAVGKGILPSISEIKKIGSGYRGSIALLSDDLVYKTDLDPIEATRIASEDEIKAYEKLQGRLSPLLYKAVPGQALITERIQGRPLKEILDRIARPYKEIQQKIQEANKALELAIDSKDATKIKELKVLTKELQLSAKKERNRFNKAASVLYQQVGQLGASLQEMGVVHNDLAAGNVFFAQGGITSIDLGNAKANPTSGDKFNDKITTIQRAIVDSNYIGLMDPLAIIGAVQSGYSKPFDTQASDSTELQSLGNLRKFLNKLNSETSNFQNTISVMQGQSTDGWSFFDKGDDFDNRFNALTGFSDWLKTNENMLGKVSDSGKQLAKPFLDFIDKLIIASQKLKQGESFDETLVDDFRNLFGQNGEIDRLQSKLNARQKSVIIPQKRETDKTLLSPVVTGTAIPLGSYTPTLLKQIVGDFSLPAKEPVFAKRDTPDQKKEQSILDNQPQKFNETVELPQEIDGFIKVVDAIKSNTDRLINAILNNGQLIDPFDNSNIKDFWGGELDIIKRQQKEIERALQQKLLPPSPNELNKIPANPLPSFFQEKVNDLAITAKSRLEDVLVSRLGTPDKSGEIQHLSGNEDFAELLQLTLVRELKAAGLLLSKAFRDTSLDVVKFGQVVYSVMQALERPVMALPGAAMGKKAIQVGGTAAMGAAAIHALPMGLDTAVVESMRTILSEALSAGGTQMLHAVQAQMTSVFNGLPFGIGQQLTTAVMQLVTELTNGTINVLASGGAIAGSSLAAGEGVKKLLGAATSNVPKLVSAEEQQKIEGKTQKALKAAKSKADSLITTEITPYFDEKAFPVSNPIPANIKAINPEYYTVKQLRGLARDQGIDVPASGVGSKKEEIWKSLTERFNPDQLTRLLLTTKASDRTKLGKKELSGFQIPTTEIPADFTKRIGIGIKNIGQEINTTKDIQSLERLYFQLEKVKKGITALRANPEFNTTSINKSLSGFLQSVDNLQTQILAKGGLESGKDYQQGLKLGLSDDSAQKIAHQNALKIVDETNKGLGNASPSWKGKEAGKNLIKGVENGVEEQSKNLLKKVSDIANKTVFTFTNLTQNKIFNVRTLPSPVYRRWTELPAAPKTLPARNIPSLQQASGRDSITSLILSNLGLPTIPLPKKQQLLLTGTSKSIPALPPAKDFAFYFNRKLLADLEILSQSIRETASIIVSGRNLLALPPAQNRRMIESSQKLADAQNLPSSKRVLIPPTKTVPDPFRTPIDSIASVEEISRGLSKDILQVSDTRIIEPTKLLAPSKNQLLLPEVSSRTQRENERKLRTSPPEPSNRTIPSFGSSPFTFEEYLFKLVKKTDESIYQKNARQFADPWMMSIDSVANTEEISRGFFKKPPQVIEITPPLKQLSPTTDKLLPEVSSRTQRENRRDSKMMSAESPKRRIVTPSPEIIADWWDEEAQAVKKHSESLSRYLASVVKEAEKAIARNSKLSQKPLSDPWDDTEKSLEKEIGDYIDVYAKTVNQKLLPPTINLSSIPDPWNYTEKSLEKEIGDYIDVYAKTVNQKLLPPTINLGLIPDPWDDTEKSLEKEISDYINVYAETVNQKLLPPTINLSSIPDPWNYTEKSLEKEIGDYIDVYAKTVKEFEQKALPPAINLGSIPDPWTEASTSGAGGQPPSPPINRPIASPDPEPEPNKQVKSASEMAREYLEDIKKARQLLEKQQQLLLQRKKLLSEALPKQSTREDILDDWNKKREFLFNALDKIEKGGISEGFAENFTRGLKAAIANFDGFINLLSTGGKALRTLDAELNAATGGMINLRKGAMAAIGGFALFKGAEFLLQPLFFAIDDIPFRIQQAVTDSLLSFTELQRIKLNLNLAGVGNVEQSLDALVARADRLGISFKESAIAYSRFKLITTGSPLQAQADNIFEGFQEALAARQTNAQQQAESFRAIGQIASKSVVSVEEFTQQLSESGGLNDALNVAARSMGLTTAQFYQQASAGNLLVQDVLPRLAAEYKRMSAGGLSLSTKTLQSEISRFQNNTEQLQMQLGEKIGVVAYPALQALNAALSTLNDNLGAVVSVGAAGLLSVMGFLGKSVMQFAAAGRLGAVVSAAMSASLQAAGVASLSKATAMGRLKVSINLATLAGIGLIKALIIPTAVIGSIQLIYSALNAGSEELKQAVKTLEESKKALDAWQNKTDSNSRKGLAGSLTDLPDMKLSGVEKFFNFLTLGSVYNYKRNSAIQGLYADIENIDKSLTTGVGNLKEYQETLSNFSGSKKFSSELQEIRNNLALVRAERTIASAKGNDRSVAEFNQREQDLMKQEQELIDKQLGPVGSRITADLQQYEMALASLEKRYEDNDIKEEQYKNRKKDLVAIISQLKKAEQDYLQVLKDQEKEYRKLQVAFNLAIRTRANANFANEGNSLSRSIGLNQQFASGKINEFQFNVKVQEESLQTAKERIATLENSANSVSNTLNKRLSKSANKVLSTYFKEDLKQLDVASFGEAIAKNLLSPDAIQQIIDQYESDLKDNAALKDILNQAKEYATARRDILNTEKEIQQISREIIVERKKRQIQEKQASGEIVKAEQLTNLANKTSSSQNINYGLEQTKINLAAFYNQLAIEQEKLALNVDDPLTVKTAIANITQQIAETELSLRDQQEQIQDYYRNLDRQIVDFNRQIEDYRRQIEDAQLSAFRENRSLSESYSDLVRELDKNLLNAQNQLLDTTDRIRVQQVKNRLLIPGTSDAGKELGDIFLEFVQGQADLASRGRTFQSRTDEIETSYISTLRNIRNLQEQQQESERNRLRSIEDIKRTQENLNRTLADLIRQTNKELGFIPQSIKDIVTNLNTLPEPIKLINSELAAIPSNIKTSGEDLVKSIEETAEAIRKAKEGLILSAPGNFIPAPVWNGGGFLPPPPTAGNNINFRQTFDGSEFAKTPKNIFTYPVPKGKITGDQGDQHRGVDVFAPVGTPVLNIRAGTIVSAGPGGTVNKEDSNPNKPGYQPQHSIKIKFDIPIVVDGKTLTHAYYTHLTNLAQPFKPGQRIEEGVNLGGVGMAGGAPHLHLGLSETANFRGRSALSNKDTLRVLSSLSSGNLGNPTVGFPKVPFASLIEEAAKQYGLDPLLFAALIKKESGFRQEKKPGQILTSSAGAVGIAQLMPGTAKELGVDPRNVTQNLIGGAEYLAKMLKRFNGNIELALSAYKAGPGNVRNGQLARGTVEDVGIVMQYYREFQRMSRGSQGGPEFSSPPSISQELPSPPSIAQLPTLPNQNQDNFWDADLPPVPKENPINFQNPNLPPVPNLPTANLGKAADQIRNTETAEQNSQEFLRRLEEQQNLNNALDRSMKFRQQQEEDARTLERTLRDASENVADLTINSKGYLTVQEEINKSATEVSRQYRSQIESLQDQRRTLLLNADAQQKYSDAIKEILGEFQREGIALPPEFVKEMTDSIEVLTKNAELAKEQVAILDQAIEQLGKNQGVATLEASFRKTRDTVRSIRDRLNDLTIQRLRLENQSRPTLFDDSAILAERISLQKEKEELEDYLQVYEGLPEYADFVANIRSEWEKLAELRLERVALDASPNRNAAESFFSDIREGKGIGSAFSSLGLNIMTKFVEGITKPAIDALTSAIDGFTKPITQAFESVFNAIIGPVGNFFTNALNSIFKPVGNIFSSIFGGGGGGGLFNGLLSGITGVFSGGLGGLGGLGSIGSTSIAPSSFISAPASSFSLGTGFSLFSDGGKVGKANAPIEKNIISAFQRERAMSGGRKPRLIVANEDELVLNPKETEAYLEYKNNAPIKNYANGGFVGGKPNYSTTSNNNNSNQSLVINNTNNVTVESRNDMGYSLNQLKERENAQNERTKKRFFS
jgi:tape measure domain-containing protein